MSLAQARRPAHKRPSTSSGLTVLFLREISAGETPARQKSAILEQSFRCQVIRRDFFLTGFGSQSRFGIAFCLGTLFMQFGNKRFTVAAQFLVFWHFRLDTGFFGGLGNNGVQLALRTQAKRDR